MAETGRKTRKDDKLTCFQNMRLEDEGPELMDGAAVTDDRKREMEMQSF